MTVADDKATVTCPAVSTVGNLDAAWIRPSRSPARPRYTITQADLNAGSVTNIAQASARRTVDLERRTPRRSTAAQKPRSTLDKTATPSTYDAVGDCLATATWSPTPATCRSPGPVTVADDKATVTCPALTRSATATASSIRPSRSPARPRYTITQADLERRLGHQHRQGQRRRHRLERGHRRRSRRSDAADAADASGSLRHRLRLRRLRRRRPRRRSTSRSRRRTGPIRCSSAPADLHAVGAERRAGHGHERDRRRLASATGHFVSVRTNQGTCTGGQIVRCNLGSIAAERRACRHDRRHGPRAGRDAQLGDGRRRRARDEHGQQHGRARRRWSRRRSSRRWLTCPPLTVSLARSRSAGSGRQGAGHQAGKGVPGVRILVTGPGLQKAADDRQPRPGGDHGAAAQAGIVTIRMTNQPARCSTRRIGVVGVFQPPPSPASLVACLALALLLFGRERREPRRARAAVPAAGHITWAQVAVRAKPSSRAARKTVLTQFRPDFRPRVVLALGVRRDG